MLVRHPHSWHKKWSIINYKLTTQGFPGKDLHPSFSQAQQDEMYSINFSSKHNDKQDHKSPDPLPKRYSDQLKLLLLGDFICVQITKCIVRSSQFYLPEQWWQQKGLGQLHWLNHWMINCSSCASVSMACKVEIYLKKSKYVFANAG